MAKYISDGLTTQRNTGGLGDDKIQDLPAIRNAIALGVIELQDYHIR